MVTQYLAKKQETRAQSIEDQVETLKTIIEDCNAQRKTQVSDVVAAINMIFGDDVNNVLTLSTIHKSKGREWETVLWLDRAGTLPSFYARQEWQKVQETNLCYVAATRAKTNLVEVICPPKPKK
jgi:superfamily I DNA/RNA helicase